MAKYIYITLLSIMVLIVPAMAKRYATKDASPFMPMREALNVAEEVLKSQELKDFQCKSAENIVTNGGECWVFRFVSKLNKSYLVEVYSSRRVRHGVILPYPFDESKDIRQLPAAAALDDEK
jgi:NAD kinase